MEQFSSISFTGGVQPLQRKISQDMAATAGAGVAGGNSTSIRRPNLPTPGGTPRKKLGFPDDEELFSQLYLAPPSAPSGGGSGMFHQQQSQPLPMQQPQQRLDKDSAMHGMYLPPGSSMGGVSSQNAMYSSGGVIGGGAAMTQQSMLSMYQPSVTPTRSISASGGSSQFTSRPSSIAQSFGMTSLSPQQLASNSGSRSMMSSFSGGAGINRSQSLSTGSNLMSTKPASNRTSALSSAIGSALPLANYGMGARTQPMLSSAFGSAGLSDAVGNGIDLADFPALAARSRPEASSNFSGPIGIPGILPSRHGYGTAVQISSKPVEPTAEFQMQNEDFPALPGSKPPTSKSAEIPLETTTEVKLPSSSALPEARPVTTLVSSYDLAPGANKEKLASATPIGPPKGMQKKSAQPMAIPPNMVQDQFGMMGLLAFIRAAETDSGLVALALGSDLTTLGLNLNSPESLCSTFASPWADAPCRAQDIDYPVPQEYLIHPYIRDKLAPIQLKRYNEDLLFFLYYSNGGELLQLLATIELYNRDWRFHKEERLWITRAQGIDPSYKTTTYERGTYCYFDATNWRRMNKDFHIEYDKLEDKPSLPSNVLNQPSHIPAQA